MDFGKDTQNEFIGIDTLLKMCNTIYGGDYVNRIKELRMQKGISMRQAAEDLGIPYTTYVNYEKGFREPNSEVLIKLANYFSVTIDYLLGHVNDPFFYLDNERILAEINSYGDEEAPLQSDIQKFNANNSTVENRNIIKIAGRDGSYRERHLTDEELAAFNAMLDALPDASDEI